MTPATAADQTTDTRRGGSEFAELSRIIRDAGLLRRRYGYYAALCGGALAAFAAGWVAFALVGDSWWQLLTAAFLALASTHIAFIGHDAGHKQIFRRRQANDVIGYLNAGLVGLSYGWWVAKHSRHHADPNHEDDDPDLDIPVLAFSVRQGAAERGGFTRWTVKYQAFLFFPLLLLEGLSLHWAGIDAAWRGTVRLVWLERALLVGHLVAYLGAVFLVLSPDKAVLFIAVHQGLWGLYMGCSFAPNHKGMPTVSDGHTLDFLRKQVLTSRDVHGRWAELALGGLNHQITHHLFPSMPRPHLRLAQPIVEAFCAERGISYSRCGLWDSYGRVLRHLHAVGAPLRH